MKWFHEIQPIVLMVGYIIKYELMLSKKFQ